MNNTLNVNQNSDNHNFVLKKASLIKKIKDK